SIDRQRSVFGRFASIAALYIRTIIAYVEVIVRSVYGTLHISVVTRLNGRLLDPLNPNQSLFIRQLDQTYALCVPARDGDFDDAGAHQGSLAADEHHFITFDDLQCAYPLAVALVDDHGDHALATTPTTRIFIQQCALTVTTLG